jgi:peroxin-19
MASKQPPQAETAPDPEEDDLDDLDDVLDSFDSELTAPQASGPGRPSAAPTAPTSSSAVVDPEEDADLQKELQSGMASLISELGENPQMQQQFEDMMAELLAAGAAPTQAEAAEHIKSASDSMPTVPDEAKKATSSAKGGAKEESFQDTIRKTMERMQASGDAATAASSSGGKEQTEEQMLAEMMKSLGAGGGLGSEEDFNSMLMSMMTQLTNKEILYEPMKELHDKFPAWMETHEGRETEEDMGRYKEQQRLVGEIVGRFERSGYSDNDEGDREYIVERMQKVCIISSQ